MHNHIALSNPLVNVAYGTSVLVTTYRGLIKMLRLFQQILYKTLQLLNLEYSACLAPDHACAITSQALSSILRVIDCEYRQLSSALL